MKNLPKYGLALRLSSPRASGLARPSTTCSELSPPLMRYSNAYSLGVPKWIDLKPWAVVSPSSLEHLVLAGHGEARARVPHAEGTAVSRVAAGVEGVLQDEDRPGGGLHADVALALAVQTDVGALEQRAEKVARLATVQLEDDAASRSAVRRRAGCSRCSAARRRSRSPRGSRQPSAHGLGDDARGAVELEGLAREAARSRSPARRAPASCGGSRSSRVAMVSRAPRAAGEGGRGRPPKRSCPLQARYSASCSGGTASSTRYTPPSGAPLAVRPPSVRYSMLDSALPPRSAKDDALAQLGEHAQGDGASAVALRRERRQRPSTRWR